MNVYNSTRLVSLSFYLLLIKQIEGSVKMVRVVRSPFTLSLVIDLELVERLETRNVALGGRVTFTQSVGGGLHIGTVMHELCFPVNNVAQRSNSTVPILWCNICGFPKQSDCD